MNKDTPGSFAETLSRVEAEAHSAWQEALGQIRKREREAAAQHLARAYNTLDWLWQRKSVLDKDTVEELGIALDTLRRLYLGCIGEHGLSNIDTLIATAHSCDLLRWWRRGGD